MKITEEINQDKTEISQVAEIKTEPKFLGRITPHENHTLFEYNTKTNELSKAEFRSECLFSWKLDKSPKKEVDVKENRIYHSCLNKKNAIKGFSKMLGRKIEPTYVQSK